MNNTSSDRVEVPVRSRQADVVFSEAFNFCPEETHCFWPELVTEKQIVFLKYQAAEIKDSNEAEPEVIARIECLMVPVILCVLFI